MATAHIKKTVPLNKFQKAVVDFRDGYGVAVAAPGSGKTVVVVERILAILREGVAERDILSLTFTKEGAKEMRERAKLGDDTKVFSTFHSWALAFIKREALALPFKVKTDWHGAPAPLLLPLDACRMLAQICRHLPDKVQWKDAQSFISRMKRRGISPQMAWREMENDGEEKFIAAYSKYEIALREKGVLDFDSIVIETANLLRDREDVRERNQYRFVQVDEAQDTDAVQWSIIKAITQRYGNALAVGDENQGMYSWRGSESNLTSYFTSVFPGARIFPLPVNYRSTQEIVEYCKEIAPNQNETVTGLSTPNEKGIAPAFRLYCREDEEAKAVILGCQDLGNTAILARTNRQLAAFENECANRGLRYKLLGKSGFWAQREVKDVLAIIGAVVKPTDTNIMGAIKSRCELTKFIRKTDTKDHKGVPSQLEAMQAREVGKASLYSLLLRYQGDGADAVHNIAYQLRGLRSELRMLDGATSIRRIVERFGVLSAYDEDDNKDENVDNDPRDNVMKIIEYAGKKKSADEFFEWTVKVQRGLRARTDCLTLSTIHQSKGKEWPYVFVVGVNQDVLPHIKGELEEERRIFFVACSRAAKKLHVSANGVASELIRHKLPIDGSGTIDPWSGFELLRSGE
jgi:DNA helicase-2/ATP-dependent DNA helicase PcrA